MKTKKKWLIGFLVVIFVIASLWLVQKLLQPKYMEDLYEGALIGEYYDETTTHDVVFIGDCEVYENFSPITLWEDYGITSYIRGSAQQLMWQSYYLMEETLKHEKPDVMIFNILAMQYGEPQNEAYNRLNLDGMKWSYSKAKSVKASMTEEENFMDYVFPLLRYHSRWSELKREDFQYLFSKKQISHGGFLMRTDVKPVESIPEGKPLADYQFSDTCYEYLDKMVKLCEDNDVQLIFIKAPSVYPYWYDEWETQIETYSAEHNVPYYNFLELNNETGIDYQTDTYDNGLHLNLAGAEKMSKYFGRILQQEYGVKNRKNAPTIVKAWDEKVKFYNAMKKDQEEELEKYGYLKSYGARKPNETGNAEETK